MSRKIPFAIALSALLATTMSLSIAAPKDDDDDTPIPETPSTQKVKALDYGKSSAHNPCFDNKGLWPDDAKKAAYFKQEWKPARVLVWTPKGKFSGPVGDKANWREYAPSDDISNPALGKPAQAPPDENTDVVFPPAEQASDLQVAGLLKVRHLTICQNVRLTFDLTPGLEITGNMWVRQGGLIDVKSPQFVGDHDVFYRNDPGNKRMMHKMPQFNKTGEASAEIIGNWGNRDGLKVNSGLMIIGPDSSFWGGNRHPNEIMPKAKMILLSSSTFQTWQVRKKHSDIDVYGTLQAGMPDRPLTSDARLQLSPGGERFLGGRSLDVHPEGAMAVYSADPTKARLMIAIHSSLQDDKERASTLELGLLGKLNFNGVEFNNVQRGGILLSDPSVRKQWKNVTFGKDNAGAPDELFGEAKPSATKKK
jgi:hypothetical protein